MRKLVFAMLLGMLSGGAAYSAAVIPSTTYVENAVSAKANDNAVVHLDGDETIGGAKTFSGTLVLSNAPAADSNSNHVATTGWTNDKVDSAKGYIPVGSSDSNTFTKIWIEE